MLNNWLDRIGDWNPQLFRELKGRLKMRNVLLTVAIAIVAQAFLMLVFYNQLPSDPTQYSRFWTTDSLTGDRTIDWPIWWQSIFQTITWVIPYLIMAAGSYMLITDLGQEERRGTLNFLRLSPQSAFSILHGKLLGVPILAYLAIGLTIPLHGFATLKAGIPLGFLVSFYGLVGLGSYLVFSLAGLFAFLSKQRLTGSGIPVEAGTALAYMLLIVFVVTPGFLFWNVATTWQAFSKYLIGEEILNFPVHWFLLDIGNQPLLAHLFVLTNLGIALYATWQALYRSFHMPTGSIFSKGQSYWLSAYPEILMMGFLFQPIWISDSTGRAEVANELTTLSTVIALVGFLASWHFLKFVILTAILTPHRQTVLDWTRYRHLTLHPQRYGQPDAERNSSSSTDRLTLRQDLIFGERSPALVAIALNLGITALIWLPILGWMMLAGVPALKVICAFFLSLSLMLIYAIIFQFMLLLKTRHRLVWAIGSVGVLVFVPFVLLAIVSNGLPTGSLAQILLLTPFLWAVLTEASLWSIGLAFLGQVAAIGLLTWRLNQRLQHMGASASKALLTQQTNRLESQ